MATSAVLRRQLVHSSLMFLSNRPLRAPCHTTSRATTCHGLPGADLDPGGILVGWFEGGFPEPVGYDVLSHTDGQETSVDSRHAKIDVVPATLDCKEDGGTVQIDATIATGPGDNEISMSACLSHHPGAT